MSVIINDNYPTSSPNEQVNSISQAKKQQAVLFAETTDNIYKIIPLLLAKAVKKKQKNQNLNPIIIETTSNTILNESKRILSILEIQYTVETVILENNLCLKTLKLSSLDKKVFKCNLSERYTERGVYALQLYKELLNSKDLEKLQFALNNNADELLGINKSSSKICAEAIMHYRHIDYVIKISLFKRLVKLLKTYL